MSPKKTKQTEPAGTEETKNETPKEEIKEVVEEAASARGFLRGTQEEVKPVQKQKRKCSEKQLAALAEGRKKNPRWQAKLKREEEAAKQKQ